MINSLEYNINNELDIIDVQALDMESDQTWLYSSSSGKGDLDIAKWRDECEWIDRDTTVYKQNLERHLAILENVEQGLQRQKFDSRTFTRPKKRVLRPNLHSVVQGIGTDSQHAHFLAGSRTITKHPKPLAEERRPAFNTNTITRSREHKNIGEEETSYDGRINSKLNGTFRLDSGDMSDDADFSIPDSNEDGSTSYIVSKPIQINLAEPAHNLHNTFNKILASSQHRNDSLSNMSPPSLVSSIAMDGSGTFNSGTFSRQGSMASRKDIILNDEEDDINYDDNTAQNSLCSDMTTSILDEKEMNTSMLSQCQDDSLIGSLPPSLSSSMDASTIGTSTLSSSMYQSKKDTMESSLINSGTFTSLLEPADEKFPSGKPKFQLRKSFLKPDPDDNFDRFLMLNANCNTEDLRGLSEDLLKSMEKRKGDTYRKDSEKENVNSSFNKDDSFLMADGMSDSFLKETGRESLNITYSKLPNTQRTRLVTRPQMEMEQTIILPNQVLSPRHNNKPAENNTFTINLNGTYDAVPKERETPKRNGTFIRQTPPSIRNVTATLIDTEDNMDNVKDVDTTSAMDSNKECYVSTEKLIDISAAKESRESSPTERLAWTPQRRKDSLSMVGGSSDSLEQNSSGSSSPRRNIPLNMDDLEHLAYEQEQKLYQVISTPINRQVAHDVGSATMLFRQNALSPIHLEAGTSSSSSISESPTEPPRNGIGALRMGSPRRLPTVKRESSAPEIKANPPSSLRMPFAQKLGYAQRSPKAGVYGSDNGLYVSRSVGGSPAKTVNTRTQPASPFKGLSRQEPERQLAGSDDQLRKKSGLPASKLRQYSSHKELNRIPAAVPRWSGMGGMGGLGALRPSSRLSLHASNPVLCPAPLVRQSSYTLVSKDGTCNVPRRDFSRPAVAGGRPPGQGEGAPGRMGTNLAAQASAGGGLSYGQPMKAKHNINNILVPGVSRPSAVGNQSYIKMPAPPPPTQTSIKPPSTSTVVNQNPVQSIQRLPRPSGLPRPSSGIPRKPSLRPPSTYSIAPRSSDQTSDCY